MAQTIIVDQPLVQVGCILGEGPVWDAKTQMLHFVDISDRKVYHLDTNTLDTRVDEFDEKITSIALRPSNDGLACTTQSGYALILPSETAGRPQLQYLTQPFPSHIQPHTRFNDGACDSRGRYFAGSMWNPSRANEISGKLYRYDPALKAGDDGCVVLDEGPFTDSNGLGWSPDDRTFYFTDSWAKVIYAYDYDIEAGNISNRRPFIDGAALDLPGMFDGLCVDEEGCIWSAMWDGSHLYRFKEGRVDVVLEFPKVYRVTSCCFGGPNLDQLYITTAHCAAEGGDEQLQLKYPDSGHLYKVDFSGQFRGAPRGVFLE
ncbi:hypothetical protein BD626DRAFT_486977 [Schizophyllum amplum]|uniref:SMP-30/Gluconolactonase/LRE-like region domain-containing protein n=1 Tax=Schizophyllum amplum TaxID=97359 RepID=A0A550CN64_9AGAR|nr:hypothetical protein BD626DRAFT_486977 [Auriculariopsis ampla]